jgi:streptogramin lyase
MNDDHDDTFAADAAAGLKRLGGADPAVVERLQGTVTSLPDRRRRPAFRRVAGVRPLLGLAAALAVVAIVAGTLVLRSAGPGGPTDLSPIDTFTTQTRVALPGNVFDLAYDPVRNSLWFECLDTADALYRYDIATGTLTHWALPRAINDIGYTDRVAVAPDGSVWLTENYSVIRVDPTANTVQVHSFALADPDATSNALDPNNPSAGTWPSAIAFDSQGMAIVARHNVKSLVRLDASMSILGRIPLPAGFDDPGDLVDVQGVIYAAPDEGYDPGVVFSEKGVLIGKTSQGVNRFGVSGTEIASIGPSGLSRVGADASMSLLLASQGGTPDDRLALTDDGAAIYGWGPGAIEWVSPAGDVLARFSLPTYSVQNGVPGGTPVTEMGQNGVSALAADKSGSVWYVDGTARQLVHMTL